MISSLYDRERQKWLGSCWDVLWNSFSRFRDACDSGRRSKRLSSERITTRWICIFRHQERVSYVSSKVQWSIDENSNTTHLESHDEMSSDYHAMTDVSWSLRIDGVCPNVPKRRNFTTVSAIRRRGRLEHLYLTFYLCLSLNLWELLLKTSKSRHDDKFDWLLQLMNEKQISVISLSFWVERTTTKSLFFADRSWIFYDLVSWSFHTNEFIVSSWS